jgi:hypothetical protein
MARVPYLDKSDLSAENQNLFATLRAQLDNERLIDLVMTIAVYNGVVRLLATPADRRRTRIISITSTNSRWRRHE